MLSTVHFLLRSVSKTEIVHVNNMPKRSQAEGSSEIAVKLLKQQMSRLCATANGVRSHRELQLPRTIATLNLYFPYRSTLSRTQLLFSQYISTTTRLIVRNPVKVQKEQYQALNAKRILNLAKKENNCKIIQFLVCDTK